MSSYRILSHPNILLVDHLEKVHDCGMLILKNNNLFNGDRDLLKIILVGHDLGKTTEYFQEYIKYKKDYGNLKNHGLLSALITYCIINKLYDMDKAIKGFVIVKKHHGNLDNFFVELSMNNIIVDENIEILEKQLDTIDFNELNLILNNFELPNIKKCEVKYSFIELYKNKEAIFFYEDELKHNVEEYFKFKYFYSILIYSDKHSLIIGKINNISKIIDSKKIDDYIAGLPNHDDFITKKRNKARLDCEQNLSNLNKNKKIYTLTLPTGMGKTLTSLNFALKLRKKLFEEENIYYNLIYSFPFTSIIDQTYDIFQEIYGNDTSDVLKHHYLSPIRYKNEEDYFEIDKSKFLIETWDSNIVVTTFVKVLGTIFSNKNSELIKFHKFANSIIILDEVQNIPHKYWKLISVSFNVLSKLLNVYFIFMTATQPIIFHDGIELVDDIREYFGIFNRTTLNINLNEMDIDEFIDDIRPIILNNSKVMVVLNTIKSAQEVFKRVKSIVSKEVLFLSASIIPKERVERIKKINELESYVIISTQVIEAGVDIDNDVVIRDIGPWDSIVQCAGRCNRHNKDKQGQVYIYKLKNDKNIYANLIYGRFLISKTENILKQRVCIDEKEYLDFSKSYFKEIEQDKSDNDSDEIIEDIKMFNFADVAKQFKLIDNNLSIMPVFIERDEKAIEVWKKYDELFYIENRFERMNRFLEIKEEFLSYVINISSKKYPYIRDRFFGKIPYENIEDYYSEEYGFKTNNDATMFF